MRFVLPAAAAVAALLFLTAPAGAHIYRPGCTSKIPARAELACARANRDHALATLRWARTQQRNLSLDDRALERIVLDHRWLYRTMTARIAEAHRRIVLSSYPPHHALWMCIHSGEAGWSQPSYAKGADGVSLYWGGMQMHADWGYGTSHHASDDSQVVQEWSAERAYRASGYSSAFLWQQWAADARCF